MNEREKEWRSIFDLYQKNGEKNDGKENSDILPEESSQKYMWKTITEKKNYVSWYV